MNAIELAEYLEDYSEYERATDIEAADMLRKQHAAIVKLRGALDWCIAKINCPSPATVNAKQAMKDTAQFDSLNQPAYTEDFEMINTKAIRAAAEAATPGPWETTCNHPGSVMTKGGKPIATCSMQGGLIDMQANVNHIAISNPTAVIALLDRLEAAEKALKDTEDLK